MNILDDLDQEGPFEDAFGAQFGLESDDCGVVEGEFESGLRRIEFRSRRAEANWRW